MSISTLLFVLAATLATAFISGIFGMAGGIILIGVLTVLFPLSIAMVLHGFIQLVSNGWRAFLLREHIDWKVIGRYLIGAAPATLVLIFILWRPEKTAVYIMLGILPLMAWLPKHWFFLDVQKKGHSELFGFVAQSLNSLAGTIGPVLDLFFVRSEMTRQAVVATKGTTQVIAHFTKIVVWSVPLFSSIDAEAMPPTWLFLIAVLASMTGTWMGGRVLDILSDANFRKYSRWLLTLIAVVYLLRGLGLVQF